MEKKKNKLMKLALMGIAATAVTSLPVEADSTGTLLAGGCGASSSRGSYSNYSSHSCNGYTQQSCNGYTQQYNGYGGYTVHGCGSQSGQTVQHSCSGQSNGVGHQCGSQGHGCSSSQPASTTPAEQPATKVEVNAPTTAPQADQKQSRNQSNSQGRYTISQTTNTAGTVKADATNAIDQSKNQGTNNTPQNMLPSGRQNMNPVNNTSPDASTGSSSKGR